MKTKTAPLVLLTENIHPRASKLFTQAGYQVTTLSHAPSEQELLQLLSKISILGIRSQTQITPQILRHAPRLHTIGAYCIGTNQIHQPACTQQGIAVFNAPYSNTRSVVELVVGEIIMLYRKAFDKSTSLHQGVWDKSAHGCHEIRGKKLGIIGYGNIGSQLSVVAESLGMQVYYYDVIPKLRLGNSQACASMEELLTMADIVTVHVDGRPENRNLIDFPQFQLMQPGTIFLNLSRGFIVNLQALSQNITSGHLAGAAVDVYPEEPAGNQQPFTSPLQGLPNTILTPHLGSGTEEAQLNIAEFVTDQLLKFVSTGSTSMSTNFPHLQLPNHTKFHRFVHLHQNRPGVMARLNSVLAKHKLNIEGQYLQTNSTVGYVITETNHPLTAPVLRQLAAVPHTISVRKLS